MPDAMFLCGLAPMALAVRLMIKEPARWERGEAEAKRGKPLGDIRITFSAADDCANCSTDLLNRRLVGRRGLSYLSGSPAVD